MRDGRPRVGSQRDPRYLVSLPHARTGKDQRTLHLLQRGSTVLLANAAVILATSPKSNSAYMAYAKAEGEIHAGRGSEIPLHLRSPQFKGYKYPHDFPGHWVEQQYLPDDLKGKTFYEFGENKTEQAAKQYFEKIKGDKA